MRRAIPTTTTCRKKFRTSGQSNANEISVALRGSELIKVRCNYFNFCSLLSKRLRGFFQFSRYKCFLAQSRPLSFARANSLVCPGQLERGKDKVKASGLLAGWINCKLKIIVVNALSYPWYCLTTDQLFHRRATSNK